MPEKQTLKGKVAKINLWKDKPGYFVEIEGSEKDLFGYKQPKFTEDKTVTLTISKGTGNFADKWKIESVDAVEHGEIGKKDNVATAPLPKKDILQGKQRPDTKTESDIKNAVALKAAAEIVSHVYTREEKPDTEALKIAACILANGFRDWLDGRG